MVEIEKSEVGDITLRQTIDGELNEVTVPAEHFDIVADAFTRMVKPDSPASKIQVGSEVRMNSLTLTADSSGTPGDSPDPNEPQPLDPADRHSTR